MTRWSPEGELPIHSEEPRKGLGRLWESIARSAKSLAESLRSRLPKGLTEQQPPDGEIKDQLDPGSGKWR